MTNDRYAKFDYGRLIAWDQRLAREWRFLEPLLAAAPARTVVDLGCGPGEHARFLAARGFDVLGIDSSPAMLEKARAAEPPSGGRTTFIEGSMLDVASLAGGPHGALLCLGNALPHLTAGDSLQRLAEGTHRALLPGAVAVIQLVNYDRYEAKKERALPLTMLPDPDDPAATIVFLRTMEMQPERRVVFMPTVLRQRPDADPPLEILGSQRVEIRSWRQEELEGAFRAAGFAETETFGSYAGAPFEKEESRDVIFVARR